MNFRSDSAVHARKNVNGKGNGLGPCRKKADNEIEVQSVIMFAIFALRVNPVLF